MSRSLRIAIADDEPVLLRFVRKMLNDLGHEVISQSQNGSDLVDQCRLLKPDLIITDVTMPELDGLEATWTINKEQRIPVILASSQLDLDNLGRDVDFVVARLPKPIDIGQLACDGD
jgi:response regulator NasT